MDVIDTKSDKDLLQSTLAELAKAKNELQCATNDTRKAQNRISFLLVLANKLIDRMED
jgi:hypothetical protein